MASQLSGRWVMRWILSGHHFKDKNSLSKLKNHTTTACLCSNSSVGQNCDGNGSITNKNAPVLHLSHNASSKQRNEGFSAKLVEDLQNKISHLSVASCLPSGLYMSPPPTVQYRLPAHVQNELTEQIIVDPAVSSIVRECPSIIPDKEIEDPAGTDKIMDMPPFREEVTKQAKITNIILIRRKKMRKHKLKKLRKRMKFLRRIILANRKKKKRKLWEAHLEKFKFQELTDEMIQKRVDKVALKRNYIANYLRQEAGLTKKSKVKMVRPPPPPVSKITPAPILPPGAIRH